MFWRPVGGARAGDAVAELHRQRAVVGDPGDDRPGRAARRRTASAPPSTRTPLTSSRERRGDAAGLAPARR